MCSKKHLGGIVSGAFDAPSGKEIAAASGPDVLLKRFAVRASLHRDGASRRFRAESSEEQAHVGSTDLGRAETLLHGLLRYRLR